MSTQSNVFSALQPEKRKKKTAEPAQNKMFASFVNNPSTSAWGDDSDDEMHAPAPVEEEVAAPKKPVTPARTLSKKEKKELENKEFEAALADLGIQTEDSPKPKEEKEEAKAETPSAASSDKKKKKKKGKKPTKAAEPEAASSEVVDIKAVMKTKGKKKKAAEPAAVRIAREEKAKAKNKGKKDKSSFNEFSI
ncbi:hypothetical protein PHMEG_0007397 [Phytophthora megakarya]|uniref:Uncharacterized protein n=1 Tax=Phytophthora megakarya TaxID=4795 RepID=A0A225WLC7_9STRA|nr:hypothetical protein PHMEG_0007397 [Phytophthora megakarya]